MDSEMIFRNKSNNIEMKRKTFLKSIAALSVLTVTNPIKLFKDAYEVGELCLPSIKKIGDNKWYEVEAVRVLKEYRIEQDRLFCNQYNIKKQSKLEQQSEL